MKNRRYNNPKLQEYAELFNEAAPRGMRVRYYPVLPADEDAFEESVITTPPWTMGGRTVVSIEGHSGGVCVSHLVLINPKKRIHGVLGFIVRGAP